MVQAEAEVSLFGEIPRVANPQELVLGGAPEVWTWCIRKANVFKSMQGKGECIQIHGASLVDLRIDGTLRISERREMDLRRKSRWDVLPAHGLGRRIVVYSRSCQRDP